MPDTNPFQAAFDLQRTAVEQTHKATLDAVEMQKTAANQMTDNLEAIEQAQAQGTEMSRDAIHALFDALGNVNPDMDMSEMQELVDEQFDAFEETHAETWDAVYETTDDGIEGFEGAADSYAEFIDSSFDGFLDAHEQVEESTTEAAEQVMETASEMTDEASTAN